MTWRTSIENVASLVAATAVGGLVIGVSRAIILRRYGGWWQWASLLFAAVLVAVLTMLAIHDTGLSQNQQAAIIGVCAFLAEDILLGIVALSKAFSRDPIGTIQTVWDAIRGRAPNKDISPSVLGITHVDSNDKGPTA